MKKFSNLIVEASGNVYQKGTPFSNGHRSRKNADGFLFDQHLMIDLDEIIFRQDGSIWAIVENKKQLPGVSSKLKNILTHTTVQKVALLELSKKLECNLFVHVEMDQKYHLIKDLKNIKTFDSSYVEQEKTQRNYFVLESDNKIFVEFRYNSGIVEFTSISTRVPSPSLMKQTSKKISTTLGVKNIEVDDTGDQIKFYLNGVLSGSCQSVLDPTSINPTLRSQLEIEWEFIYKKLGIF